MNNSKKNDNATIYVERRTRIDLIIIGQAMMI